MAIINLSQMFRISEVVLYAEEVVHANILA